MIDLKNKVMIVTGGSRGIGASICQSAAAQGAKVLVNYVSNSESASSVVEDIEKNGGDAIAVKADVTDMSSVQEMVTLALESWSKIDILVNNAAIWNESPIEMMSDAVADETMSINFNGSLNCIRAVVPTMIKQGSGSIINISSTAAQRGEAFHSHYAASKGAINSLTKSLASELGPKGIRVNSVCPGWTYTDMTAEVFRGGSDSVIAETIPLRRIGKPEDCAAAVLFLASDDASYITGISLNVNGGSVLTG
ncbi:3-oxoacyl-ACP reductase FabG [Candidatus Marinimicrobia bacterium MT.SAG.4]|nr:3-oxoacyl-ACP reductase FabG [Candidatus Marinimicrobia bacterium MT.SAG.4]